MIAEIGGKAGWNVGSPNFNHSIRVYENAKCSSTEGIIEQVNGKNMFALTYVLEGGAIYCGDNQ